MAKTLREPRPGEEEKLPLEEVELYLRTGNHENHHYSGWPGRDFFDRAALGAGVLRRALVDEVRRRAGRVRTPKAIRELDTAAFTRARVEPMVRGLFPGKEREVVLGLLESAVVFLTPRNIEEVLLGESFHHSAWTLANLYLGSVDAELLGGEDALRIVGMSQATTCFVTMHYFEVEERFADFVVHECAHVFHNWKRERCGLPFTRRKEWLLQIEMAMRETFAYGCEAYSRLLALGRKRADREVLLEEHLSAGFPGEAQHVDHDEYAEMLREAVAARNGWKRILVRCARRVPQYRRVGRQEGGAA